MAVSFLGGCLHSPYERRPAGTTDATIPVLLGYGRSGGRPTDALSDCGADRTRRSPSRIAMMELRDVTPAADRELARALLRVQHAAYSVEAALIGDDRIPPLRENVDDVQSAALLWLAAFTGDALVGAVAWTEDPAGVDIDRLAVVPHAHRRGVGSALVRAVLARAADRRTTVSTGRENTPARGLYERLGFTCVGEEEVIPGLWITRYVHPY
jgi:ribosomal protein S18 acetylase RimI-like enzyme